MEEITAGWSRLSLQGPEGEDFRLRSDMGSEEFVLAAKFFTKRALNTDAIARNFSQLWRSRNGFRIKDLGNHIVLFIFDNKLNTDKILASQPWSFDKSLVAIQRYDKGTHARDLVFDRASFWVQVYDIPIQFMNKIVAEGICSGIGEVCASESPTMEGGDFLRVRVKIDILKPLNRGRKITLDDGSTGWVSFKYERLPNICYWCGCLTHGDKDCDLWIDSEGTLPTEARQYGAWLRAPLFSQTQKSTVVVPGFYKQRRESFHTTATTGSFPPSKLQNPSESPSSPVASTQKVTPVSPPIIITNQVPDDTARICEDFPPGFEGQAAEKGKFARQLQEIDEGLAKFEDMEGINSNEISLPYKDSDILIPSALSEKNASQTYLFPATCDPSALINVCMSAAFPTKDIPKTQETYLPVTHPPGQKWTRVPRTVTRVSEVLDVHAGNKRSSHSALYHPGLLKKSKLVSQDEQENSSRLAVAGSQPRQEP